MIQIPDTEEDTLEKMDDKSEKSTNNDILNYLRQFKDAVAKDNKKLEKKVENMENKIEVKLDRMRKINRR